MKVIDNHLSPNQQAALVKTKELILFLEKCLRNLGSVTTSKKREALLACTMGLFVKVFRTLKAVRMLCEDGLSEEAHCLVRVLVEAVVTLQSLHYKDPEERAYLYLAYHHICMERIVNARKGNKVLSDVDQELETLIASRTDDLKKEYGDASYEEMRKKKWKGIVQGKIENAFKEVGHIVAYDTVYRFASLNIHSDDFLNYITRNSDGSYFLIEGSHDNIEKHLSIAGSFTLAAMEIAGKAFRLGSKKEIKKRKKYFTEFIESIPDRKTDVSPPPRNS